MQLPQKQHLINLNRNFYTRNTSSFAHSRQQPWQGWRRLAIPATANILDLAAGNLRFKHYLDQQKIAYRAYLGVDVCQPLLEKGKAPPAFSQQLDILQLLLDGQPWYEQINFPVADFIMVAGFTHHIPGQDLREKFLADCSKLLSQSGILVITFWEFITAGKNKLVVTDLGDSDYLLSWQGEKNNLRYCHNFNQAQVNYYRQLLTTLGLHEQDYFRADGKSGSDNHYLVYQKN